jgi:hypothetical protein
VVKIIATLGASLALLGCGGTPDSFVIIPVETINTAPLISEISDKTLGVLGKLPTIPLEVSDEQSSLIDIEVSAVSSNQAVINNNDVIVELVDGEWLLTVSQSRVDQSDFGTLGQADITVTVSDGELADTASFTVEVFPRINQYVAMGTHNSYKEEGPNSATVADWNYSHDNLDRQLNQHRVRSFELDIHWSNANYMQVYHVSGADPVSMCDYFGADPAPTTNGCLEMIKKGLDANPNSLPAMIMIEPKDVFPQDPQPGSLEAHWRDFDSAIRDVFPLPADGEEDQIITPVQVLGTCDTLAEAVSFDSQCGGWPDIESARGKALVFIMVGSKPDLNGDCTTHGRLYREQGAEDCDELAGDNTIENWVAFIENEGGPNAAIARCDSPTDSDCFGGSLTQAAAKGVLIRTRSDSPPSNGAEQCALNPSPASCGAYQQICQKDYSADVDGYQIKLAQALASGAHMVSTEHPAANYPDDELNECPPTNTSYQRLLDYYATVDGEPTAATTGLTALCNPANQPAGCIDSMFNDAALD